MPALIPTTQWLIVSACLLVPSMLVQAQTVTLPSATASDVTPADSAKTVAAPPISVRPGGRRGGLNATAPQAPEEGMDVYPVPPDDFRAERKNIPHGELTVVEYDSKTLGTRRLMRIYTPPGYSSDREYPVLYLHHGLGNTSTEWIRAGAQVIADNLLADGKMQPMIIILPQGSAGSTAVDENQGIRDGAEFGAPYENDLLNDIIPFVESNYSVDAGSGQRAIAGMSMGGGQTLNIGLSHLDVFGSVAAVAAAPNTQSVATLIPDPTALKQLKLLWLGVGNRDPLMRFSQGIHTFLEDKEVPHIWRLDGGGHDPTEMGHNFYHFAQLLFNKESAQENSDIESESKQPAATDEANLPAPPTGWDAVQDVPHGEVKQSLTYPTRNHGEQLYSIWFPPGYSTDKKYPVLYMLHGFTDDQTTWINQSKGRAHNILDNYLADGKIVPMLVVFPNGALGDSSNMQNFGKFDDVLLNDLIPHIDSTYSTLADPVDRAVGGWSMGGGQSLKFGLPHTDVFNWIGAFAPAAHHSPAQIIPDPSVIQEKVQFIYLGVGTNDGLKRSAEQYHKFFDENGISHVYQLEQGLGHDWNCCNRCFYNYVPSIFTGNSSRIP